MTKQIVSYSTSKKDYLNHNNKFKLTHSNYIFTPIILGIFLIKNLAKKTCFCSNVFSSTTVNMMHKNFYELGGRTHIDFTQANKVWINSNPSLYI